MRFHRHARGSVGRGAARRAGAVGRGAPAGRGHRQRPCRSARRLAVYGGKTILGLTNAFRAQAGIVPGDEVEVVIDRDDEPREVEVPPELAAALYPRRRWEPSRVRRALVHAPPRVRGVDR